MATTEIIEVQALPPGASPGDAFAAAWRTATSDFVMFARPGSVSMRSGYLASQAAAVLRGTVGLACIALAATDTEDDHTPGLGAPLRATDASSDGLWPVAVVVRRMQTSLAVGRLESSDVDPWVEVVERLSLIPGAVQWRRATMGGSPPQPPADAMVAPPTDGALYSLQGGDGPQWPAVAGSDRGRSSLWVPLWVTEPGAPPDVVAQASSPGATWACLGELLRRPSANSKPLVVRRGEILSFPEGPSTDDSILGWARQAGLPGDEALGVIRDARGYLRLGHPSAVSAGEYVERVVGWVRSPEPGNPDLGAPPAVNRRTVPLAGAGIPRARLHASMREGTRPLFRSAAGSWSATPAPGLEAVGFMDACPGPGRAPVVVDGLTVGYAECGAFRGTVVDIGAPLEEVGRGASAHSLVARRLVRKVRSRRTKSSSVLFVLPWFTRGGADALVHGVASALRARGNDVHVVLTYAGAESPGDLRQELASVVTSVTCPPEEHPGVPTAEVIRRIARRERVGHLAICGGWQIYASLPGLRAALPGTRIIDILFNDDAHIANNRRSSRWIDVTVCAYEGLRDLIVDGYGESPSRVDAIYVGVDPDRFRPATAASKRELKAAIGADPERPLWGYAGRLSEEKCLEDLVRALYLMGGQSPATVLIQGEGPAAGAIDRVIQASGGRIIRRPFQDDPVPTLQALDCYVLPSRVEGVPLALMEAAACGAIPVASAVGGVPDLVVPGVTGYLFAPGQPSSLAAALSAYTETSPERLAAMAYAARQRVMSSMTWERTVAGYLQLFGGSTS